MNSVGNSNNSGAIARISSSLSLFLSRLKEKLRQFEAEKFSLKTGQWNWICDENTWICLKNEVKPHLLYIRLIKKPQRDIFQKTEKDIQSKKTELKSLVISTFSIQTFSMHDIPTKQLHSQSQYSICVGSFYNANN